MNMIISESEKKRILTMHGLLTEKFSEEVCGLDKFSAENFWQKVADCDIELESSQHEYYYDPKDYRDKFWELVGTNENEIKSLFDNAKQFYTNYYNSDEGYNKIKDLVSKKLQISGKKLDRYTKKVIEKIDNFVNNLKVRFFWTDPSNTHQGLKPNMELYEPLGIIQVYLTNIFKNMKKEYDLYDEFLHEIGHSITNVAVEKYLEDNDVISDILPSPTGDEPIEVQYSMDPEENIVNLRNIRGHFNISPNETPKGFYEKIDNAFTNGEIKVSNGYTIDVNQNIMTITKTEDNDWDSKETGLKFFNKNNEYIDSIRRIFRRLMDIDTEDTNVATIDLRDIYDLDRRIVGTQKSTSNVA